jgi:hypothetical protein
LDASLQNVTRCFGRKYFRYEADKAGRNGINKAKSWLPE